MSIDQVRPDPSFAPPAPWKPLNANVRRRAKQRSFILMSILLTISAIFVSCVAAFGFLFGQAFSGHFSAAATIAGIAGLFCGGFAFKMAVDLKWAPLRVYWACVLALAGVAMDAGNYYWYLVNPGSYYAWHIIGPFAACIAFFAYAAIRRRASFLTDA